MLLAWEQQQKKTKVGSYNIRSLASVSTTAAAAKAKKNVKRNQPRKNPVKTVKVGPITMRNPYSQGDMVMTTARNIGHPTYEHGEIRGL